MQEVDKGIVEQQLRKLRRRLEEFFRHASPEVLLKYAAKCGLQIPKLLTKVYGKPPEE